MPPHLAVRSDTYWLVICPRLFFGVFVRLKFAGEATPAVEAVTVSLPAVEFAVKVGAVATPLLFVTTVADPLNVPLAPLPGAANVTDAPAIGLLNESLTSALSAVPKAVPTMAL